MIFVTGGTGLVGSHLLLALLQQGKKVRALKRAVSDTAQVRKIFACYTPDTENMFRQIEWIDGDILDIYSLDSALENVDTIYHCAAMVSFSKTDYNKMLLNNVEGTANLVNAALEKGVRCICHVSSIASLGNNSNKMVVNENFDEVDVRKLNGYAAGKFLSEKEIWRGIHEGLDAVIVNPSIIIGPAKWKNGSASFFRRIDKGMPFYTLGSTGYVDVRDVVDAMLLLTENENFEKVKNQRFLLNAVNLTYRDFFSMIAKALNKPKPRFNASPFLLEIAWRTSAVWSFISGKPSQMSKTTVASAKSKSQYNGSKIEKMFGFKYRPIEETISQTAKIYISQNKKD